MPGQDEGRVGSASRNQGTPKIPSHHQKDRWEADSSIHPSEGANPDDSLILYL